MTMDKSWKDMPLGPSEKDHERWAKESAVRIAKQMDEALKKADTASTMTIEIKQVDHSMSARIMSFLRGTEGNLTVMRSIAAPLFEQAANRIAELERQIQVQKNAARFIQETERG